MSHRDTGGFAPSPRSRRTAFAVVLGLAAAAMSSVISTAPVAAAATVARTDVHPVCLPSACAVSEANLTTNMVARAPAKPYQGYWTTTDTALIRTGGSAEVHGLTGGLTKAVGIASSPDGFGYWVADAAGDVKAHGDSTNLTPHGPALTGVIGIASSPRGQGVWTVSAAGAVRAYGSATGLGGLHRDPSGSHRVTGIAASAGGTGYWLVDASGAVTAFGTARTLKVHGRATSPVKAIAATPDGHGYLLLTSRGQVLAAGSAADLGSAPAGPGYVGIAATGSGLGYWVLSASGSVYRFGDAKSALPVGKLTRGLVYSAIGALPTASRTRLSTLHINVTSVPSGLRPMITVTAPNGQRRVISASTAYFNAMPGTWTIRSSSIRAAAKHLTYFSQYQIVRLRLAPGADGIVPVSYQQVLADTTRVTHPDAIRWVRQAADGRITVLVDDPDHLLVAGSVLASGVGPATPQGLLLDVVTATRTAGNQVVLTGASGSLTDLGPQATISVSQQLPTTVLALGGDNADSQFHPADKSAGDSGFTCSKGVHASVNSSINFSPTLEMSLKWGGFWHPLTIAAKAVVGGRESLKINAAVKAAATCKYQHELLAKPIVFSAIKVQVGPVPVIIVPKLNFEVGLNGTVTGAVETTVNENLAATAGLNWDGKHLTPIKSFNKSFSMSPLKPAISGSLTATIGPKLEFDIYDIAGPYVTSDATISLAVNPQSDPWWKLTAGFQAGAGLKFKVWKFGFDKGIDDLLSVDWPLAQATIPPPPIIAGATLPNATVGSAYSAALTLTKGRAPYSWAVSSGALPVGISLNSATGVLVGTPALPGTSTFTVTVTDANGLTGSNAFTVTTIAAPVVVASPTVAITTTSLPAGVVADSYSATLATQYGVAPYTWTVSNGSLPAGVSLASSTGVLSGTPTTAGTSSFTLQVVDHTGATASKAFTISTAVAPAALTETFRGDLPSNERSQWTAGGSFAPCLTASSAAFATGITTCGYSTLGSAPNVADNPGSGALRLTSASNGKASYVIYQKPMATSQGMDITFTSSQYGTVNGADGISFFLVNGLATPSTSGPPGGSLGYSGFTGQDGLSGALLGVGLDAFGNFASANPQGPDCAPTPFAAWGGSNPPVVAGANNVVVRGPEGIDGRHGYCYLGSALDTMSTPGPYATHYGDGMGAVTLHSSATSRNLVTIRVHVDPVTNATPMVTVFANGTQVVSVPEPAALQNATSFKFGFSASTGSYSDVHEISDLAVTHA